MTIFTRTCLLSAFLAASSIAAFDASAQTCTVPCGKNSRGEVCYKEVYEYDFVSSKPSFPGGNCEMIKFINKTRQYPACAYKKGIEGRVTLSFIVNCKGEISNVSVLKGAHKLLDDEAVRIISQMPLWEPGRHDGKPVSVRVIYTIAFRR